MRPRLPSGPSRRLIALLFAITLVPLVSLLWLGRYLLEEDRRVAIDQEGQRLARAADLVTSAIERAIASDDQRVASGATDWPDGAVVVTFAGERMDAVPSRRLAYYPDIAVPPLLRPDPRLFDAVDRAEFQQKDLRLAIDLLEGLSASADPVVRPAARLRLAHTVEETGDYDRALEVSAPLLAIDDRAVADLPTAPIALLARYQRCRVLARLGRSVALGREAAVLRRDLITGRWRLTASVYALYLRDAVAWLGGTNAAPTLEERMADAAAVLWTERHRQPVGHGVGPERLTIAAGTETFGVLWQPRARDVRALIATPEYVEAKWLAAAFTIGREEQVDVGIGSEANALAPSPGLLRQKKDTGLPWNLAISRSPAAAPPQATSRRALLIMGLVILITTALAASYFIARAVHREIAVARIQSDFVAAVSHEFRTPLTALRQFTDMLREGGVDDEDRRQLCYDAQARATDRLTHLVESVLDFGRMEAGKRPYQFESVSCTAVVRTVVEDVQREIVGAGYRIECRADQAVEIEADSEALGRALRNLLENAVKYSPDARTVEVDVTRQAEHVSIAVRDRGIGVAPDERDVIFDQFHRGAAARSRGIAGTGIGLAMVDHIVRAHHGRVDVESELGKGSTFTIVLPVRA